MTVHIAFLRAINLGATRKFPKASIVAAAEGAGFTGVATHINTGNVRVETSMRSRARLEQRLEAAFAATAGFEVPTIAFTQAELRTILAEAERFADGHLPDGHGGRHYVSLLKDEPSEETIAAIEARSSAQEVAKVGGRAVHLLLGESYHAAKLSNAVVERQLGVATNRNLTVIRAIVEKWC